MCSTRGARALPRAGCPIQKPPDHRSLPTPRRLSQVAASFFGSWCLGIHLGPLLACSTYNHSSVAEELFFGHVKSERGSRIFAFGILEISIDLFGCQCAGGDERIRTADPLLAKQVLSQLSYIPWAADAPRYSDASPASPSARGSHWTRGRFSDLESLKSGKDRTQNSGVHSICEKRTTDLHRVLSRLPNYFRNSISRFRDDYSSPTLRSPSLRRP